MPSSVPCQNHLTGKHHRDVIRHAFHLIQHVRGKENRAALVGHGADDRFQNVASHNWIEAGTWFIEEQQFGAKRQRDQQAGLGILTAGKIF